jgi:capsular exopolysaccharide synthesis family protein
MEDFEPEIFNEEHSTVTVKDRLSKYLRNWPVFVISLTVCLGAGIYYYLYTAPKYLVTTSLMVLGNKENNPGNSDLVSDALKGKQEVNLNNEILLLSSAKLMERTVAKYGFNVFNFHKGRILNIDIYKDAPFHLNAKNLSDSNFRINLRLKNLDNAGGYFMIGLNSSEKSYSFKWGIPFAIDEQTFVFDSSGRIIKSKPEEYIVQWRPVREVAAEISKALSVKAFDPNSNVIVLSLITGNIQKGVDILNDLFEELTLTDVDERNNLSKSTVQFIDNRLLNITGELKGVEENLEGYQGNNAIVDIKGQSSQSLENSNSVSKTISDINVQMSVVDMISNYFSSEGNSGKLVPSSLGLNDGTLTLLITQYNELQLKKQREAPLLAPNSTVMQDLNTQLANLKNSITESLSNIKHNLQIQQSHFQEQKNEYKNILSSIPHNERVLQEIKRKQGITEGLYLYLLQKREEAAISSTASNVAHYKQLDSASGEGPVEPNLRNTLLSTILLGLAFGFIWIYVRDLLNDKINGINDIKKRTSLKLTGEISQLPKKKKAAIAVLGRTLAGEEFRVLRTNISFLAKYHGKKTILVTSTMSGEGKSFISLNLAAVCAIPGKKVALLEFDIRNPSIAKQLSLDSGNGITNFLTGEITRLQDIRREVPEIPTLHIYPCGPLPSNAADLLLVERFHLLFETLRATYDFIIVDSPPAGLVSDPFILGRYSDIVLYIIRQQKTSKKDLNLINDIVANKTLSNVFLVLNDAPLGEKYKKGSYYYR